MSQLESQKESTQKEELQESNSKVVFTGVCMDCGNEYSLTVGEIGFYKKHDLFRPKRCNECRKLRRPCCDPMKTAMRNGMVQRWKGGVALVLNDKELLPIIICPFGCGREYPKPTPHVINRGQTEVHSSNPESSVEVAKQNVDESELVVDTEKEIPKDYLNLLSGPEEYDPNA